MNWERLIYYVEVGLTIWLMFFTATTVLAVIAAFGYFNVAEWFASQFYYEYSTK